LKGIAIVTIGINIFSIVLIVTGDCSAILGLLAWCFSIALCVLGVLTPAIVGLVQGSLKRSTIKTFALTLLATVLPPILFQLMHYKNTGHCIA